MNYFVQKSVDFCNVKELHFKTCDNYHDLSNHNNFREHIGLEVKDTHL